MRITIEDNEKMAKIRAKPPLFYPWSASYKCRGEGFFFDGEYGYYGVDCLLRRKIFAWRNMILSWFGLCVVHGRGIVRQSSLGKKKPQIGVYWGPRD